MIRSLLGKKFPFSRLALTVSVGSSLLATGIASAQQVADPAAAAPAERVVVTGSNIPTAEEVGFSPVDTIDQATRDRTGQEDVLSVLTESNPAISSGGGNLGASNASISSSATYGGSQLSIHGLPTLVLLDGRRLTDSSAAAAGGDTFTDVNLFPSALVKRIEVLKDGASAIYGTEAVGGVVNVILDQEFQGFEFSARYGFTEKSDVQNQRYSGIFGFGDDKTHIVIGAEYTEQDPLFDRDRNFSAVSFGTTTYPGVARFNGSVYQLLPGINSPSQVAAVGSIPAPTAGVNPIPAAYGASSSAIAASGFNLAAATGITLDQNRTNVFSSADRQLLGDHIVAFADILYASNYSQSYLNAQPVSTNTGVVIPIGSPYNPFAATLTGTTPVLANNRFVANPRIFRNDTDFYRVVAGLKGEIVKDVNYEVAFNSSRDELTFKNPNLVIAADVNQAIAGGFDANGAADPAVVTNGVVTHAAGNYSMVNGVLQPALDFFGKTQSPGATNGIFGDNIRYLLTKFEGVDGKVYAFPVTLPAGPLGFAAGGEYRHESLKAQDSPEVFVGSVPIGEIDTGRDVEAGFTEIQIPLVSPEMHVLGVYRADIDGAGRFENFEGTGSTWVPKVGFTFLPIQDVALRGSFSKSFIAPTLYQTHGPSSEGFTNSFDFGAGSEQAQSISGSNPVLASTRADTYTAGIVISPHQVQGLTMNADFFHVEESRLIGAIDPVTALNSVNNLGTASPFSQFVHFGSFTGPTNNGVGSVVGNGPEFFVTSQNQNLGRARIGGIDFGINYTHTFGEAGTATMGVQGTYYLQYKESTLPTTATYDIIGIYNGLAGETEQYHLTPTIGYEIAGFSVSAIGNYIPSMRDANSIGGVQIYDPNPAIGGYNLDKEHELPKIRDYYSIDLLTSYEFHYKAPMAAVTPAPKDGKDGGKVVSGKNPVTTLGTDSPLRFLDGLKLSFGIQNLTNARPSQIENSPDSTNTDASIYDPYQRQYYFVITKKF